MKASKYAIALVAILLSGGPALTQEPIKIGFLAPMSGPLSVVGNEVVDGFKLGLSQVGNKIAGRPVELFIGDDQGKPDVGRQAMIKLLQSDRVDIAVIGGLSNILLAVTQPVFATNKILLSVNPGTSTYAGKECNQNFFVTSFQNDGMPEAVGAYMNERYKHVYFMAPNYQGGRDTYEGFKRYYKGEIVDATFTPFNQLDFAPEIAQIRQEKPEAVYFFYFGSLAVDFLKQWAQSGPKDIQLVTHLSLDQTLMPAVGDAALGIKVGTMWSEDLDNPANKAFVKAFRETYKRIPSPFAANSYDGARLLTAAATSVGGKIEDTDALRAALETANFNSVRGNFRFNKNHFPVQDYFMTEVVKNNDGTYGFVPRDPIFKDHADAYVGECQISK